MGFMDKVKAQAEQAMVKAQQGVAQGQVKFETYQASRNADAVLRELGRAYYAHQRAGGSPDVLDAALRAVDEFVTANGPIDTTPRETSPSDPPPAAAPMSTGATGAFGEVPAYPQPVADPAPAQQPADEPPPAAPGGFTVDGR